MGRRLVQTQIDGVKDQRCQKLFEDRGKKDDIVDGGGADARRWAAFHGDRRR